MASSDNISGKIVQHIASLARLSFSGEEVDRFTHQLNDILDYVGLLEEVDTKGIEPTAQVTGLTCVARKDDVDDICTKEELLGCTELPVERDQIKVQSVIQDL